MASHKCASPRSVFCHVGRISYPRTRNLAERDSPPPAGCCKQHLLLRRSAIPTECFLSCRKNFLSDKKEFRLRNSRAERGRESDIFLFAQVRSPRSVFYRIGRISYPIKKAMPTHRLFIYQIVSKSIALHLMMTVMALFMSCPENVITGCHSLRHFSLSHVFSCPCDI